MPAEMIPALGANTLPEGEAEEIRALIEKWSSAYVDGRMADWERFWTEDPVLMPAGHGRITGRGEIASYLKQEYGSVRDFRFSEWSCTGQEDLAVVSNHLEVESSGADRGPDHLNQVLVLRRGPDRDWHVQTVIITPTGEPH